MAAGPVSLRVLPALLVACCCCCVLLEGTQQQPPHHHEAQTPDWRMTLKTIRNGVHKIDTYLNAALDLLGGEDGLCRYKCSDGYKPFPRYGYKPQPPNGCGSPLFGVHFDIGIPSMTKCCNQHDRCYDTCGNKKHDCDEEFQYCLSKICRDVQKTLGIPESVQGEIQVDSKNVLQLKGDGQQNLTETDAMDESQLFNPAAEYKMNHKRRGLALIFNHEHFFWHLMLPERRGTLADRENLKHSLTELGFEVKCFDDLKAEEVLQNIYNVSTAQHEDADCFMCIFLSHGEDDHVYAYDAKIKIQSLTNMFRGDKCPSLVGKPKIFIIQACRGDKHDDPVNATDSVDSMKESDINETKVDAAAVYTLPAGADFLMCYSVAEGYYSHRETVNGSWYIQDLCKMIRQHGSSLEFTELLTLVNRKVSHRKVDVCRDINALGKKQIPCFASMLTKKLHFRPKSK